MTTKEASRSVRSRLPVPALVGIAALIGLAAVAGATWTLHRRRRARRTGT